MKFSPRLSDARTNPKVLSLSDKIGTIQRRLKWSSENAAYKSKNGPHTNPELVNNPAEKQQKLTKLLLNLNIQNSLGPIHVVISPENTVGELIKAAIEIYAKEKRRPLLPSGDSRFYDLHYSQFSLESLKREEKLHNMESRSFFLCRKPNGSINSSCKDRSKGSEKLPILFAKFMDLLP